MTMSNFPCDWKISKGRNLNFYLCTAWRYMGNGVTALLIHNCGTRWRWVVSFRFRLLPQRKKRKFHLLKWRLSRPRAMTGIASGFSICQTLSQVTILTELFRLAPNQINLLLYIKIVGFLFFFLVFCTETKAFACQSTNFQKAQSSGC